MSQDPRPVRECLNDLTKLIKSGASGNFYLATPDNDIAVVSILGGAIDAVNYQGRRGDFAVELLKEMKLARCSFRAEQLGAAKFAQLSEHAKRWLTGQPTSTRVAATNPPPTIPVQSGNVDLARYRQSVESVALSFFGPIAGTLCEGVFADSSTLIQVLDELSANLPPDEASRFKAEVAKTIRR